MRTRSLILALVTALAGRWRHTRSHTATVSGVSATNRRRFSRERP